jgi:hypothetical protein
MHEKTYKWSDLTNKIFQFLGDLGGNSHCLIA